MPLVSLLPLLLALASVDTTPPIAPTTVVKVAGELGYVSTAGNSSVQTLSFGDRLSVKSSDLTISQSFNVVYGRNREQVVTSLWRAALRADVALRPTLGLYGVLTYERNVFAGLERRLSNTVGVASQLLKTDRDKATVEGGFSLTSQRGVAGSGRDFDFLGGRAAGFFSHLLNNKASLSQLVEVLPNFKHAADLRINTESILSAPITKQISVRLSYVVRYDGLPEPGFLTTDRLFVSGMQVSL